MYILYVYIICIYYMYILYVYIICIYYMHILHNTIYICQSKLKDFIVTLALPP